MIFTAAIGIILFVALLANGLVDFNLIMVVDLIIGYFLIFRVFFLRRYNIELQRNTGIFAAIISLFNFVLFIDRQNIIVYIWGMREVTFFSLIYIFLIISLFWGSARILQVVDENEYQLKLKQAIFAVGMLLFAMTIFYDPERNFRPFDSANSILPDLGTFVGQAIVIIGYMHLSRAIEQYPLQQSHFVDPDEMLYRTAGPLE